jgi:hypothetical protein
MRTLLGIWLTLSLFACTDEAQTIHALTSSGFNNIQITGYAWFGCSDSDTFHTAFTATNPVGQRVSGIVCCGYLKSCTVRF